MLLFQKFESCLCDVHQQYEEGSAPALAIKATMERTQQRFANYGSYGLLCGADGLPHLIVDGDLNHLGEFTVRSLPTSCTIQTMSTL